MTSPIATQFRSFFSTADYDRVMAAADLPIDTRLAIVGDMIRVDTLSTVYWAKTGHLGASLSAVDVLAVLYFDEMKLQPQKPDGAERDVFVMSKGHAAPSQYATLAARGFFPTERLKTFRRFGGLAGHVDRSVPGADANTGSLGMGISKAKGHAWSQREKGLKARAFVMIGDGELQEGQNWEALQSAGSLKLDNLYLIVDKNHVQTDLLVKDILDPLVIEDKLRAFGWEVRSINGHAPADIRAALADLRMISGKPKAIVADTVKGRGISYMEHPVAMKKDNGYYYWHAKVPNRQEYVAALAEVNQRIQAALPAALQEALSPALGDDSPIHPTPGPKTVTSMMERYGQILLRLAPEFPEMVVLDGDLEESCGLRPLHQTYPRQFLEVGCGEQDMVSMAGAMALQGKLPILNTYSAFLSSRANEQIFNNATEQSRVIYAGHMCGLVPATPGKSHQGVRDIAILKGIPNLLVVEPASEAELEAFLRYAARTHQGPTYMRIANIPAAREIPTVSGPLQPGRGSILKEGADIAFMAYGPILLAQVLEAAEGLAREGKTPKVVNMPWLNRVDPEWLAQTMKGVRTLYCVENHAERGGLSDDIARALAADPARFSGVRLRVIAVEGFAQSGQVDETLDAFRLSAARISATVHKDMA